MFSDNNAAQLINTIIQIVVDHYVLVVLAGFDLSPSRFKTPADFLFASVTATAETEAFFEYHERRRQQENANGVKIPFSHLARALNVNHEDNVSALALEFFNIDCVSAITIPKDGGPFKKIACHDHRSETWLAHKIIVYAVDFSWSD